MNKPYEYRRNSVSQSWKHVVAQGHKTISKRDIEVFLNSGTRDGVVLAYEPLTYDECEPIIQEFAAVDGILITDS